MTLLLDIEEVNSSQTFRVILSGMEPTQSSDLIGTYARFLDNGQRLMADEIQVVLGADHEEGQGLMDDIKPCEIQVAAIHDIEGSGLDQQFVQNIDIVEFSLGNGDKTGNRTPQIQQSVELDRRLGSAKPCPAEQVQTQVDGRRIQSVNGFVQLDTEIFGGIKPSGFANEILGQIGINPPIPLRVGASQIHARYMPADSQVIKLGASRTQTGFDVAQTLAIGQLREGHAQKMIPATEPLNFVHAAITIHASLKLLGMDPSRQLRKNSRWMIHPTTLYPAQN